MQAVVPDDELDSAVDDLVEAVLGVPAMAAAATVDLLRGASVLDVDTQLARERAAQTPLLQRAAARSTEADADPGR